MIQFISILIRFVRTVRSSLKDPEFEALFLLVAVTLASGTVFYWQAESWSILDSLYVSVTTLTTIGYEDLSPSTTISKVFTIFYVFIGIGIIAGFVNATAQRSIARRKAIRESRRRRKGQTVAMKTNREKSRNRILLNCALSGQEAYVLEGTTT